MKLGHGPSAFKYSIGHLNQLTAIFQLTKVADTKLTPYKFIYVSLKTHKKRIAKLTPHT